MFARDITRGDGIVDCTYNNNNKEKKERKAGNIDCMFPKGPSAERQRASTSTSSVIADYAHANEAHALADHAPLSTNPATAEDKFTSSRQLPDTASRCERVWKLELCHPQSLARTID